MHAMSQKRESNISLITRDVNDNLIPSTISYYLTPAIMWLISIAIPYPNGTSN